MTSVQDRNRRILEDAIQAWNAGDVEAYLQLFTDDVQLHGYPEGLPRGIEGARQYAARILAAFSAPRVEIDDVIAEGDRLAVRMRLYGRHTGVLEGVLPTYRDVEVSLQMVLCFCDGRCSECWQSLDEAGLWRQLGVPVPVASEPGGEQGDERGVSPWQWS